MFNRVRDGLVYPKELVNYRKDRIWRALFFILFFGILLATSSIINVATYDGSDDYFEVIDETKINTSDTSCVISDSILSCDTQEVNLIYTDSLINYYIDSSDVIEVSGYSGLDYNIVLNGDQYYVIFSGVIIVQKSIESLPEEFHNIDIDYSDGFYNQLFDGLDSILKDTRLIWGGALIAAEVFLNIILYLFFVLLNSMFLKRRFNVIPYKELFVMSTYAATTLFVVMAFNSLLNLPIYIVIILIIIAFRQTNILAVELNMIIRKNNKE